MTKEQRDWCIRTIKRCGMSRINDKEYGGQDLYAAYLELCLKVDEIPR